MRIALDFLKDSIESYNSTASFINKFDFTFKEKLLFAGIMREYAKEVASQALKDAAENASIDYYTEFGFPEVDKQSILNTEIKLP